MNGGNNIMIDCSRFEELLSDYLDKTLDARTQAAAAEHALACPLCHSLLNDVRESIQACRAISAPAPVIARLEARVLEATIPDAAMACADFEEHLTDYLDGFLPANVFHRWERHAVICDECTDLPGMVVRSIAACYTYKTEELPVPAGLEARILQATTGALEARRLKASRWVQMVDRIRSFAWPIPAVPQLAPVAMMLLVAFFVFTQAVSADGTLSGVYQKGFELAERTYQQSAEALNGGSAAVLPEEQKDPVTGTTYVGGEDNGRK